MDDPNNCNDLIRAIAAMKTKMQEMGDLTRSYSTNDHRIGSINSSGRGRGGHGFYRGGRGGCGRGHGGRQGRGSRQGGRVEVEVVEATMMTVCILLPKSSIV